jgi:hypothetical protein
MFDNNLKAELLNELYKSDDVIEQYPLTQYAFKLVLFRTN